MARKDYQKVRAEMAVGGMQSFDPDGMGINYDNQRVAVSILYLILQDIRSQLGTFDYSTAGITGISSKVEARDVQTLPDNQARYEGEWIVGQ